MKTFPAPARLMRGFAIALARTLFVMPMAQGYASLNSSGRYLDLSTNRIMFYSSTGTLSDLGVNTQPTQCLEGPTQCGQCQYAPNDNSPGDRKGWQSSLSQYAYGWCGNVDVSAVTNAVIRGDVRVLAEAGKEWSIRYRIDYMKVGQSAPVESKAVQATQTCANDGVTVLCAGSPFRWNPKSGDNAPASGIVWNYYCVHTIIYDTPLHLNPSPVADGLGDAVACSGLVR